MKCEFCTGGLYRRAQQPLKQNQPMRISQRRGYNSGAFHDRHSPFSYENCGS